MPTTLYKGFNLARAVFPLLHGNSKCASTFQLDPVNCKEFFSFYSLLWGIAEVQQHGRDHVPVRSLLPKRFLLI